MKLTVLNLRVIWFLLVVAFVSSAHGQYHYKRVWSGSPYQPMNITVTSATLSGAELTAADEIGVFDNGICVGWVMMGPDPARMFVIVTSMDNPATSEVDGFTPGHPITYWIWKNSWSETYRVDNPTYSSGEGTFSPVDSAVVTLIANLPTLSVSPNDRPVSGGSGTTSFQVSNTGGMAFFWMASSNASWATITSGESGTNMGTVWVEYSANPSTTNARTATITVSAPSQRVLGTPQVVTITQAPAQATIGRDVSVTFRVNMNGAKDYRNGQAISGLEAVYLAGEQLPLQWPQMNWTFPDTANGSLQRLYDDGNSLHGDQTAGDDIWSRILTFKASDGVSSQLSYKYGALYPGVELNGANYLDNENAVGANHVLTLNDNADAMTVLDMFGALGTQPVLLVTPDNQDVESTSGTTSFVVSNTGSGTMAWTASSNQLWATIVSGNSGTNAGTVNISFTVNPTQSWRVATVTVTAAGAAGSPKTVTVCQTPDHSVILKDVAVNFRVNMNGAKDYKTGLVISGLRGVFLAGEQLPLQWPQLNWTFPDTMNGSLQRLYDDGDSLHGDQTAGDNIWSTHSIFRSTDGVPPHVEYKYGALYPGVDLNGSNYLDNENAFSVNHSVQLDDNTGTMSVLDVFGALGPQPVLSVAPEKRSITNSAGSVTYSIVNTGTGNMDWTATSDQSWATVTSGSSGTNTGTISIGCTANSSSTSPRTATITVSAAGAIGSPKTVTLEQAPIGGLIARDVTVAFHVNMSGAKDFVSGQIISGLAGVYLAGNQLPLKWPLMNWEFADTANGTLQKLYDDGILLHGDLTAGDNVWSIIQTFRASDGIPSRVEYKYGAGYPGVELNGSRYLDNENALSVNHVLTLDDVYGVMSVSDMFGDQLSGMAGYNLSIVPKGFELLQNYPNPCNPSTTIRYGLPDRSYVVIGVFNTLGQQVALLQAGEQSAGYHEVRFSGRGLASGMYFYRMQAGKFVQSKKLILTR